ncbi:DUF4403 family protein [Sphingobium sp. CR2-8]|uniref:DUF4403 family protein n=1 Tax=Sphingobium sp. CR2-8 TaxID=1306534 RepID=UPI002DBEEE97|nr:DUF4403 family protein [Sphingobium sp. CR2-8]MEC3911672.1 DUF4403 family protein [Sphingobium sp. CR2-8]
MAAHYRASSHRFARGRTPALVALILCVGCQQKPAAVAPPRASDPVPAPQEKSLIAVPVEADSAALREAVEQAVPRILWTINRREPRCVAPQKVKIFGGELKVTPPIGCTIVGTVTRGAVSLRGEGRDIIADLPIHASISARDVGGVLKGETATGSAMVKARITIDLARDWTPKGTVQLHYDWTTPPGIDFLGQRIRFTDEADEKLRPIVARLERDLPRELAKMNLRSEAEKLWRQAFTTLDLNKQNPPVWMRVSPQKIFYNGYVMRGQSIRLDLGMEAITETFVGDRPADPRPTALPPLDRSPVRNQLSFFLPVTADYRELQPVVQRALSKRATRPFDLPGIGAVSVRFSNVACYGATGGRIAVGVDIAARPANSQEEIHGRIWLAARPVNAANSPRVGFVDPVITGDTDGVSGDMLLAIGQSPGFSNLIASALGQNFAKDIEELKGKIGRAIADRREGDFVIKAHADRFDIGTIHAYGQGLHLPVRATGKAQISYRPL